MDRFFDLFENVDLVNIDKILLTKNDKDKVYNLFKNLKESINLCQVAYEVKNIKNRCRQRSRSRKNNTESNCKRS